MEALLLIGHGSRAEQANEGMFRIAGMIRKAGGFTIVECGFLQLCPPTIEEALGRCIAEGAERVLMVPYFLHTGIHIREDLPAVVRELREHYPHVEMTLGAELGDDPLLAQVVMNRVEEIRHNAYKMDFLRSRHTRSGECRSEEKGPP